MTYFVTGATGFIGRHLVEQLLENRRGTIYVLVREGSLDRLDQLHRTFWDSSHRIVPVVGVLTAPLLGVDERWVSENVGKVRHFFHLAALYDMTASAELNEELNILGTREAIGLAAALDAGVFHQASSVAAAGDYRGVFDETMFAEGQLLPSPYHETKYESERIVREECEVPWRVYRPALSSATPRPGPWTRSTGPTTSSPR